MSRNSYPADFATRCFDQIEGFGTYGFPESHAASFALLVYVSAWIKCFYPDVFACALLNSQPMGFYAPAQIVRDAREHGVEVRRSISISANGTARWSRSLSSRKAGPGSSTARRHQHRDFTSTRDGPFVGPRVDDGEDCGAAGAHEAGIGRISTPGWGIDETRWRCGWGCARSRDWPRPMPRGWSKRAARGIAMPEDLWRRSGLGRAALERLAAADALRSLGLDRRQALVGAKGARRTAAAAFRGNSTVKGASDMTRRAPSGSLSNPPPPLPRGRSW